MAHQVIGHQNISPKIIVPNYLGWNKIIFSQKVDTSLIKNLLQFRHLAQAWVCVRSINFVQRLSRGNIFSASRPSWFILEI